MPFYYRLSQNFAKQRSGCYWQNTPYVSGGELVNSWSVVQGNPATNSSYRLWESYTTKGDVLKRKKPTGVMAISNAGMTNWSFEEQVNTVGINSDNAGNFSPSTSPGVISIDGAEAQRVDADALLSFLENIKAEKFNLPVFLGEGKETINFIVDVVKSLGKTYNAVKRGRFGDLYRTVLPGRKGPYLAGDRILDKSANMWMQWRYAVQPMVYDFQDILDLAMESGAQSTIRFVEGKSRRQFNKVLEGSDYYRSWVSGTYKVAYGGYYEVTRSAEMGKRLGVINLAQALYECTPASFILDWVIPIGRTIGAADALVGVNLRGWYRTTKVESVGMRQRFAPSSVSPTGNPVRYYGSPATTTYKLYSRVIAPPISVPVPSVSESLSLPRILDAITITHGLVRGFRS